MNNGRVYTTILIFVLVLVAPYWLYLPLLFAAVLIFPLYFEGIFLGFIIDVLYSGHPHPSFSIFYPVALVTLLIVLVLIPLKKRMRINA